jgi:disulfide bond formation protein DsbB
MDQRLSRVISALLVIVLSGVITAAFGYQMMTGQQPCPLCFLQRVAMIGIATGQLLNFRFGIKMSHHSISLFHCILGAAVSLRQLSLHVCPGFAPYGTPILGFGLYTWAFIAFVCSMIVIAVLMFMYNSQWKPLASKSLKYLEGCAFLYILAIVIADIITAAYVCGIKVCPDNPL